MLVLSRRPGEALVLTLPDGREVVVRVLEGGPVRLGIDAPADVAVARTSAHTSRPTFRRETSGYEG